MKELIEKTLEEFAELFDHANELVFRGKDSGYIFGRHEQADGDYDAVYQVERFIKSALEGQVERVREEMKKLDTATPRAMGYKAAIIDILELLK